MPRINRERFLAHAEELPFRRDRELRESKARRDILCAEIQGISYNRRRYSRFSFHAVLASTTTKKERFWRRGVREEKFSHTDLTAVALTDRERNASHVRVGAKFVV